MVSMNCFHTVLAFLGIYLAILELKEIELDTSRS